MGSRAGCSTPLRSARGVAKAAAEAGALKHALTKGAGGCGAGAVWRGRAVARPKGAGCGSRRSAGNARIQVWAGVGVAECVKMCGKIQAGCEATTIEYRRGQQAGAVALAAIGQ